ncbi:BAR/IMD domain-containing adapter protein 2-like 2 [Ambystoma mexicanum]|uniref:BAR/IMD domain-containing adapter protein 2-like 2 n=1 Tax=Ambystoma mexicanum TaxID=8296 RepID=UPI0037E8F170
MDVFYASTINIYKNILEQFNPALDNLVYLGNNYMQALNVLSDAAEVYFKAIKKIGEQALESATSQTLGRILVHMADSQIHLTAGLELVLQTFHGELLQHLEKNTKLDMQFINDSQKRYELEYQRRAANLDKGMSEVWRMERKRDKNLQQMKESVNRLHLDMQGFVSESQRAAELEEKRRYRFLAEKHCVLSSSFLQFYNRARGILQSRVPQWKEQVDASRSQSTNLASGKASQHQGYSSSHSASGLLETQRPLEEFNSFMSRSSNSIVQEVELEEHRLPDPRRRSMQRTSSMGSLNSEQQRSRSNSFGEVAIAAAVIAAVGAEEGGARVQALVNHSTSGNKTLLRFSKGDIIQVLVPEARNGWLYGKLEQSTMTGWFPEAYVKSLEDERHEDLPPRSYPLRSAHSAGTLLDSSNELPAADYRVTADTMSSRSTSTSKNNSRRESIASTTSQGKFSGHPRELFPRGTNPFATVKLRPTVTNDRSAPLIR